MEQVNFIKVENLEHLKQILNEKCDGGSGTGEFFIQLNNGIRSWKTISFASEVDKNGNQKFEIHNENDETRQILTEKNLFDGRFTNIGNAIQRGQFYFAWC